MVECDCMGVQMCAGVRVHVHIGVTPRVHVHIGVTPRVHVHIGVYCVLIFAFTCVRLVILCVGLCVCMCVCVCVCVW